MAQKSDGDEVLTTQDIVNYVMAGLGIFLAVRAWSRFVKPWLLEKAEAVQSDPTQSVLTIGDVGISAVDAIGAAVLVAVVAVTVALLRRPSKSRKREGERSS